MPEEKQEVLANQYVKAHGKRDLSEQQNGQKMSSSSKKTEAPSVRVQSAQSNDIGNVDYQGIILESMTGPQCQIDEIDDFSQATVGLLKDAVCHCLNLADWV